MRALFATFLLVANATPASTCFEINPAPQVGDPDAVAEAQRVSDAHQQHLLRALADQPEADALLSRAMLIRSDAARSRCVAGEWRSQPDHVRRQRSAALLRQAAFVPDADAHALLRIGAYAKQVLSPAEREAVLERLLALAPGNLAVRELQLDAAAVAADPALFDRWLADSASATHHDSYFGRTVTMLVTQFRRVPPSPALLASVANEVGEDQVDPDLVHGLLAFGYATAIATPALATISEQCDPLRAPVWSEQREQGCVRAARLIAEGDTVLSRRLGLAVWHRLVEGRAEEAEVVTAKRELMWLQSAGSRANGEVREFAALLKAYERGADEIDAYRERMAAAGLPSRPPADWTPANPAWLQARQ